MGVPKCLQQSDKQGPAPEFKTKPSTNTKLSQNVPHQTLTHRESRQVCFLEFDKNEVRDVAYCQFVFRNWIKSRSRNIKKQTKKICCKNSHQRIFSRKDFTPQTLMEEG